MRALVKYLISRVPLDLESALSSSRLPPFAGFRLGYKFQLAVGPRDRSSAADRVFASSSASVSRGARVFVQIFRPISKLYLRDGGEARLNAGRIDV